MTARFIRLFPLAGIILPFAFAFPAADPEVAPEQLPRLAATPPDKALATFQVKPGFKMELVAAEPLVADPVAMAFDANGRLFVVEMRDYSERRDERLGRIRLLEDRDEDGRFDLSTVFAEQLPWPTAVVCSDGGIFVGATPDILFLKDTNADGIADLREVVFTGFGEGVDRLNVQRLPNSLGWGLDNRIHGANGGNGGLITSPKNPNQKPLQLRGRDFSFDPRTFEIRPESGGGQNGLSFDDYGRKFVCSNSAHIQLLMYEDYYAGRNPFYAMPHPLVTIAEDGPAAEVYRLSPDEPWRVIRTQWRVSGLVPGPIEGGGRPSGYFTGATGVTIYRGNAWPPEYRGDAFIADCGSNLIHRKKLFPEGVGLVARRPADELKREFVASTDNWFRPVQFANAPDGALYVADMYREIIEHPWSLPAPIKKHLDLNSGNDRGRIYRFVPDKFKQPTLPKLTAASTDELVQTLRHENGWHRDTAARLLCERQDKSAVAALEKLLQDRGTPLGFAHALYALEALQSLTPTHLINALSYPNPMAVAHAIRLSGKMLKEAAPFPAGLWQKLQEQAASSDPQIRYQLAFVLGEAQLPGKVFALSAILGRDLENPWVRSAILSSLAEGAGRFFLALTNQFAQGDALISGPIHDSPSGQEFLRLLVEVIAAQNDRDGLSCVLRFAGTQRNRAQTFALMSALARSLRNKAEKQSPWSNQEQFLVNAIYREAVLAAKDAGAPESRRIEAVGLLATAAWIEAEDVLVPLLNPTQPQSIQLAAIRTLARFAESQAAGGVLERWPSLTPQLRSEALTSLLARREKTALLLEAIRANAVQPTDLSGTQIDFLRSHRDPGIREQAGKLFARSASTSREELIQQFQPALRLEGKAGRGRKFFSERCASCHRLGTEGHAVGPDLASVKTGGKEKLLTGILDPNREVPPSYVNYLVETKDGESYMGLLSNETAAALTLRRAFADETRLLRSEISRMKSLGQSIMPEGLEASMSHQEMADLLEFIVAGEQTKP